MAAPGRGARSRMQSGEPRPAVCRRLFAEEDDAEGLAVESGAVDNLMNQIHEEINRQLDDASKKYNFDFRTERPMEGDWVWERLQGHPSERPAPSPPTVAAEPPSGKEAPPCEPPALMAPQDKPPQGPIRL